MKVLFPVSECVPFAKTGGLADVAGALPAALARLGHEVHVILPFYRQVRALQVAEPNTGLRVVVSIGKELIPGEILDGPTRDGLHIHFVRHDGFFDRPELYRDVNGDYEDNDLRFIFFSRAVLEWAKSHTQPWDILHAHDWHTGLIPVYLKVFCHEEPALASTRSLITIHNLAYQGFFPEQTFLLSRLPRELFTLDKLEFWGGLNFLKAGLIYADRINTVSRTYAQEIQTQELGCGLDGVLRLRSNALSGIVNGIDHAVWDPARDPFIPEHFSLEAPLAKAKMKAALLAEQGLYPLDHAPLVAFIGRLDNQKGLDILVEVLEKVMALPLQLVVLGTGSKRYHDLFLSIKAKYPRKLGLNLTFDEALAHRIYAGSDLFLMPSRYEPCGLGQLISMRYGTVPVVRRTGGLNDTVTDLQAGKGNGFSFGPYTGEALITCLKHALSVFAKPRTWAKVVKNAMQADFSWDRSALEYQTLYQKLRGKGKPKRR